VSETVSMKEETARIFKDDANVSIGVDDIAKLDNVGMMNPPQDRDFPINLIHPRLRIDTLLPNKFNRDLESQQGPTAVDANLDTISTDLSGLWPPPAELDLAKLAFTQRLSKDVVPKLDFAMTVRAAST
jgi:hypothetical protein